MDDQHWLAEFVDNGSDEAFGRLVDRHIGLVYAAALREVRDRHLAEDVTQAVFMALARKAASLRQERALAAWLVVATRYVAINLLKREDRRRRHERRVAEMSAHQESTDPAEDSKTWDAVAPHLNAALTSLSSNDRRIVALRFFEGLSIEEVASQLGVSKDAAKQRLHRAVERLRGFFGSKGIAVAPAALGPLILAYAVHPAPAGLSSSVAASALGGHAAGSAPVISKGLVIAMLSTKVKVGIVAAATLLLVGGGTTATVMAIHRHARPVNAIVLAPAPAMPVGWQQQFDALYSLQPGTVLKYVPRPFIPERANYITATRLPASANNASMTFYWDRSLHWHSATYGDESLLVPLTNCAGISRFQYEDPLNVLATKAPGDWIYRSGATREQVLAALAQLASERAGRSLHFVSRRVPRQVILASGACHFAPAPGDNPHGIVMGDAPVEQDYDAFNRMSLDNFLQNLGGIFNRQVIRQTSGGNPEVAWILRDSAPEQHVSRILDQVARETGLTFKQETRQMDVWFLEPNDPATRAAR